jgi:senataxin
MASGMFPTNQRRRSQVYMVGDPVQLPATVMSKRAVEANFQRSLFKRLQDAGYPVHILRVQYRMHPAISGFASRTFYDGRIEDGPDVEQQTQRPFHKHPALGPVAFFNVDGQETTPAGSSSICNNAESDLILALIQCLATQVRCQV